MNQERRLSTISDEKGVGDDGIFDWRDTQRWSNLGLAMSSDAADHSNSLAKVSSMRKQLGRCNSRQIESAHHSEEDEGGPSLDMALKYNVKDANSNESSLKLRRKGKAIYLNDQLVFNRAAEMESFYKVLMNWQDEIDSEELFCVEGDYDGTILLALARSLAADDPNMMNLGSSTANHHSPPSLLFPQSPSNQQQNHLPIRRKASKIQHADIQSSASTPEGVLGRLTLPDLGDFSAFVSEMETLTSPMNQELKGDCSKCDKAKSEDVLQAALRYVLSCLDEINKDCHHHRDGSSDYNSERRSSSSSIPQRQRQEFGSRSQGIMKKLTKKRMSLNSSLPFVATGDSKEAPVEELARRGSTATFASTASTLMELEVKANGIEGTNETCLLLQHEKVKRAALEKELETIRGAIKDQEFKAQDDHQLVVKVAEAARELSKAQEEKAIYQCQCEELQMRLETIEEAFYNAIGLLAEKEEKLGIQQRQKVHSSDTDNDADFYSAEEAEEEESKSASRAPVVKGNISQSQPTMPPSDTKEAEDEVDLPFPGRFISDVKERMIADAPIESLELPSSDENNSRRDSQASWIRHTIIPPVSLPIFTSSLPELPVEVAAREKKEETKEESSSSLAQPCSIANDIIDYSSRKSALKGEESVSRPKLHKLRSTSEVDSIDSSWQRQSLSDGSSSTACSNRYLLTPASSLDISLIHSIDKGKGISEVLPERLSHQKSQDLMKRRPSAKRANSCKSSTSSINKSSRYSILGHMPPLPINRPTSERPLYQRTNSDYSDVSIRSRNSQLSSREMEKPAEREQESKSSLLDHYSKLHAGCNKDDEKATYFARKTRYTQEASM